MSDSRIRPTPVVLHFQQAQHWSSVAQQAGGNPIPRPTKKHWIQHPKLPRTHPKSSLKTNQPAFRLLFVFSTFKIGICQTEANAAASAIAPKAVSRCNKSNYEIYCRKTISDCLKNPHSTTQQRLLSSKARRRYSQAKPSPQKATKTSLVSPTWIMSRFFSTGSPRMVLPLSRGRLRLLPRSTKNSLACGS